MIPAPPLPVRTLGAMTVSAVGLGCMNLSHAYGEKPEEAAAARLLNHALDRGITLLDTAALYGSGANEALIGRVVGHRRGDYVLASKCVLDSVDGKRGLDGSPAAITACLDRALGRLNTDHIDLYYLHRLDARVPIEDSVGALVGAMDAGKIGAIGLSEMSAATIRRAHQVHPIAAVQSEYSPMVRNPDIAVLDTCAELRIGFVAFSPVCRGLLAGSVTSDAYVTGDLRHSLPRFTGDNLRHNLLAVAEWNRLAIDLACTPGQLAIAWLLARAPHIIPIPGTRSIAHLDDLLGGLSVTLDETALARIDAIFAPGKIRGARYPAGPQAQIDTELFPDEELAAG